LVSGTQAADRLFFIGMVLNTGLILVQVVGGLVGNSIALLADAAHNLGDVFGLVLAWIASALLRKAPSETRTYGWRRSTILATVANASLTLIAGGGLAWEAIHRLASTQTVDAKMVMVCAGMGIVINGATAMLFSRGQSDLNLRGVYLHMAADAAISAGVVVGALAVALTGWQWLDPLTGLVVVVFIVLAAWNLLKESLNLALDAVPRGIDSSEVKTYLETLPGVEEVHSLRIWALSTTETALTAHLVRNVTEPDHQFLFSLQEHLLKTFGIAHATVQIETSSDRNSCRLAEKQEVITISSIERRKPEH
jgi:cobalt-zinc-cadmium efflux system protein